MNVYCSLQVLIKKVFTAPCFINGLFLEVPFDLKKVMLTSDHSVLKWTKTNRINYIKLLILQTKSRHIFILFRLSSCHMIMSKI